MPGRDLPSRYSRLAPPPVEMWPKAASSKPEPADRSGGVATADHGEAVDLGQRLGDRPGAGGEGVELEDAHRTVPEHRPGVGERRRERRRPTPGRCRGPSGRRASRRPDHGGRRVGRERRSDHDVGRQQQLDPGRPRPGGGTRGRRPAGPPRAGCSRPRDRCALRNVNTMPPPISSRSALPSRLSMTPSLSETFEPPSTTAYGPVGLARSAAGARRSRRRPGRPSRAGAASPRRTRSPACGARPRNRPRRRRRPARPARAANACPLGVVLAGLARVEADVLQHRHLAVGEALDGAAGALADGVGGERRPWCRGAPRGARRPARGSTWGRARPWVARGGRRRPPAPPCRRAGGSSGTLARIRPSSVIVSPSRGTFRSDRTRTRLPRRSPRSSIVVVIGRRAVRDCCRRAG